VNFFSFFTIESSRVTFQCGLFLLFLLVAASAMPSWPISRSAALRATAVDSDITVFRATLFYVKHVRW
jgi:hypothetical protein